MKNRHTKMKHFVVRVPDGKAAFIEELLNSIKFVDFNEISASEATMRLYDVQNEGGHLDVAIGRASKKNASGATDMQQLKNILDNIDKMRTSR